MRVEYRSEEVKVMEVKWYEIGVRGTNALDWMREGKGRQERSNFLAGAACAEAGAAGAGVRARAEPSLCRAFHAAKDSLSVSHRQSPVSTDIIFHPS